MNVEAFRSRLLPGLEFFADISPISLDTREGIAKYRSGKFDIPAHPFEDKVHIFECRILGYQQAMVTVRIYQPGRVKLAPVVVWCHGGAFVSGDLEAEHFHCVNMAAGADVAVVAVDYRLAPEHPYPAGLEDCYAALLWTAENAYMFAGDPDRLIIGGTCAGATLAACAAIMARDRGFNKLVKQILIMPATDAQADNASMKDFCAVSGGFNALQVQMAWRHYLPDLYREHPLYAIPCTTASLRGLPDAFVVTAELDPLRDEGEEYVGRLRHSGIDVEHYHYDGAPHLFMIAYEYDIYWKFSCVLLRAIRNVKKQVNGNQ
ncbi:MAG: alpha/beta hydrolase [Bacteroidota bacterium]